MKKQYQKTCPLCGEKIVVSEKSAFALHACDKGVAEIIEKPVESKKKKWRDDDLV
jgi:transcription initiation factor IIE alpha subunit